MRNAERKAFDTLGLDIDAAAADIKARFKELVKRHHPDANGGDRSLEDRLLRDHPGVQLSEVGEVLLIAARRAYRPGIISAERWRAVSPVRAQQCAFGQQYANTEWTLRHFTQMR